MYFMLKRYIKIYSSKVDFYLLLFKGASCISEREMILWSVKNELNEKKKQNKVQIRRETESAVEMIYC